MLFNGGVSMTLRIIVSLTLVVLVVFLSGCQSNKVLNDEGIKQLAWSSLDDSYKKDIVGSKADITYKVENSSGVTTLLNNAQSDVWKEAEVDYLDKDETKEISQRLKFKKYSDEIAVVKFKSLVGESSLATYEPIKVYVDYRKEKVLGMENGKLNVKVQ